MRKDRSQSEMRPIKITKNFTRYAEGSVLVEFGHTQVLCTASIEEETPRFLQGSGKGWVTAEYGMLPRSTHTRMRRDKIATGGRTQEISRLIGRSLRAVTDLTLLPEKSIVVDCDVIQADGGTRTASITGGFVALALACQKLIDEKYLLKTPLSDYVAAVSSGIVGNQAFLDLDYEEDSQAEVDMNFVITGDGNFVEIQGTAEHKPFSEAQMKSMTDIARTGCAELFKKQAEIIGGFFPLVKK